MVSMWANLLANAATTESTNLPRFVNIFSELNGAQVKLLDHIITHGAEKLNALQIEDLQNVRSWGDASGVIKVIGPHWVVRGEC